MGGLLSLTNLYIGLKTGWGFGVAITACILSYTIWSAFYRTRLRENPDDDPRKQLHAIDRQFVGLLDRRHAHLGLRRLHPLNHQSLPMWQLFLWVFFLAILGVTMAIPMKRQMINIEQLRFPSGIAAAETLRALHSHGEKGMRAAKALGISGLIAAILKFWEEGFDLLGEKSSRPVIARAALMENLNECDFRRNLDEANRDVLGRTRFSSPPAP